MRILARSALGIENADRADEGKIDQETIPLSIQGVDRASTDDELLRGAETKLSSIDQSDFERLKGSLARDGIEFLFAHDRILLPPGSRIQFGV